MARLTTESLIYTQSINHLKFYTSEGKSNQVIEIPFSTYQVLLRFYW